MPDPTQTVHASTMLWSAQVSQLEALELRDAAPGSIEIGELAQQLAFLNERRRPVIYEFGGAGGNRVRRFVQNNPVYG